MDEGKGFWEFLNEERKRQKEQAAVQQNVTVNNEGCGCATIFWFIVAIAFLGWGLEAMGVM